MDADTVAAGRGLLNMFERVQALGGTLDVRSAPGAGTAVRAGIPLEDPTAVSGDSRELPRYLVRVLLPVMVVESVVVAMLAATPH